MPQDKIKTILVTGGAGYIGSHMCVELLQAGHNVLVLDDLSNSSEKSLQAVERITQKSLSFILGDIRDSELLARVFAENKIDAVLHFAGLKAVGESVAEPIRYYDVNLNGTLKLIEAMTNADCKTLVFSSSATVYGIPETMPIEENTATGAINPYGRSKLMVEQALMDLHESDPSWRIALLRYFNPVGAHASGEIGEDPNDVPNNLMPFISQVAVGRREKLSVFGDDYDTPDGTGVRDYIHVVDLARGHLKALQYLDEAPTLGVFNLGTGNGYSVLEAIKAFEAASGKTIAYEVVDRRAGDAAVSFADPQKAQRELDWRAEYDLARMCEDVWRWQKKHPNGFSD
ncbi:MAG: UDP-glucose 4-epimerase GalE [Pseudomonadaceae bacterium]|nr:UDP-glucose 4-epimerase GalE [Pseudomonadaceae bacterium]